MLLSKLIVNYRKQEKLSVRQLATQIGIDYSSLNRFERGRPLHTEVFSAIVLWMMRPERIRKARRNGK
jgi:transcriptional regulator with XRE-family HTH domain